MEIVKIDTKNTDDQTLDILSELIHNYKTEFDTPLPVYNKEYIKKSLKYYEDITSKTIYYLAIENKMPIGYALIRYFLVSDKNKVDVNIYVIKKYRQNGIAKQLLKYINNILTDDIKRIEIFTRGNINREFTTLEEHILSKGGVYVYSNLINAAYIPDFDINSVRKEVNYRVIEANKKGFEFEFLVDLEFKYSSKFKYHDFLNMVETIWNDMPREDAEWEDEIVTPEIYETFFKYNDILGDISWTVVAIKDGKTVGYTQSWLNKYNKQRITQDDTGVLREYRGNGLGLCMKYIMLEHIISNWPDGKYWITGNAGSNEHMLNINKILKYKPVFRTNTFAIQRKILNKWVSE